MRISLIGAGNVGSHFGLALHKEGHEIHQVYSRSLQRAKNLAGQLNALPLDNLDSIHSDIDICIIAVKDDAVQEVFEKLHGTLSDVILIHTAGSISLDVFKGHLQSGVIWPVQTLSTKHSISTDDIPLAISGNTDEATYFIENVARDISSHVYRVSDEKRQYLHLAATIASNFSNHMYSIAKEIAEGHDIPFEILLPLIRETALKVENISPSEAQTGAAIRGDQQTIQKHLLLLKEHPEYLEIYRILTKSIQSGLKH